MAERPAAGRQRDALRRYWRSNLKIMAVLLVVWATVSFGCGILFAEWLNQFRLPGTGFPLGFWFAQQGSVVVFVLCILAYCIAMNRLDRRHHEDLTRIRANAQRPPALMRAARTGQDDVGE